MNLETRYNKLNKDYGAYELVNIEKLNDLNSVGLLLKHKKSGARVAIISNDDDNKVFSIGFIALMILISFVNILNTVTTGIDLRRREFAMFKSVGITPKGFNKMICLESLLYGIKALVISIPVSILLSFLMNVLLGSDQIPFTVNVPLYLAVVAVVFVLVGSGMLLAVSKLKKDSIIEALKEDIC